MSDFLSILLVTSLIAPLALLGACFVRRWRGHALALQWLAPIPSLAAGLVGLNHAALSYDLPFLGFTLRLDPPGALLLAGAALLWIVVSAALGSDRQPDSRFSICWLLTMIGNIGVFVAGDLVSFYLFYAFAKAAMFFSAGLLAEALGHDQIARLGGAARVLPVTFLTIALGGLSLMGLPPSGGFSAKWMMLQASIASGQWLWTLPILGGSLLAAGYVYRILAPALSDGQVSLELPPKGSHEAIALILTTIAIALGFAPQTFFDFLEIGRPMPPVLP